MNLAQEIINAYRQREGDIQQRPMRELQQVGELQGILSQAQLTPLKALLMQGQLQKQKQELDMNQMFQSGAMEKMSPDQLDLLGQKLAMGGHPGAATVMTIADRRRQAAEIPGQLEMLRSQPQGMAPGAVVGNQQTTRVLAPDEAAAVAQIAQGGGIQSPLGPGRQATDNPPPVMGGGVFAPLLESASPSIASRARQLQAIVDNPNYRGDPRRLQQEVDNLTKMDATFQQQRSLAADRVANRPAPQESAPVAIIGADGKPVLVSRADAIGKTPAQPSLAGGGMLEPETLRMTAEQYLTGDRQAVQGYARSAPMRAALQNEIMKVAKEKGYTGADVAAQMADFAGIMSGSRTVGVRAAQIELASSEADKMIDIVLDKSKAFERTRFVPVNVALRAFETKTGQPEVKAFGAAINSLVNVYARAISPSGVPTVSDKEHAREMLAQADSPAQVQAVMDVMRQEMKAARAAPMDVRSATRKAVIRDKSAPEGIPEFTDEAAAIASGKKGKVKINGRNATID